MRKFAKAMVGGLFQGSNNVRFEKPDMLYQIINTPEFLVEKNVLSDKEFRYVRYCSPRKDIHVAEIQFFGKKKHGTGIVMLTGRPIWHLVNDSINDPAPLNALDGDIRTNFNAPAGSWIGYDFGKPVQIKKVRFLARNNFNIMEPGNEYELFYYDKGWQSLGVQKTKSQYLEYENVPMHDFSC
jgi:hypothetical protein